jgi:hypothetical protein
MSNDTKPISEVTQEKPLEDKLLTTSSYIASDYYADEEDGDYEFMCCSWAG